MKCTRLICNLVFKIRPCFFDLCMCVSLHYFTSVKVKPFYWILANALVSKPRLATVKVCSGQMTHCVVWPHSRHCVVWTHSRHDVFCTNEKQGTKLIMYVHVLCVHQYTNDHLTMSVYGYTAWYGHTLVMACSAQMTHCVVWTVHDKCDIAEWQ